MIKYHLTALALKGFSVCGPSRSLYRRLGNTLGGQGRTLGNMPFYYYERVERNLSLAHKYGPLNNDDFILELGTGWVHWEAVTLRLFHDFQGVLYDVWDNRQLSALKSFVRQLATRFGQDGFLKDYDIDRARFWAQKIETVSSFEELYKMFGFRYVLDPVGLMKELPRDSFRLAISAGVMEHIPAETAPQFIANMAALLKAGGLAIHSINITDHLYLYDITASPKQYLKYSESQWRFWFNNKLQYINRLQRCDWLHFFSEAGFEIIEEGGAYANLVDLRVHPQYQRLNRKDIDCTTLDLVARKS